MVVTVNSRRNGRYGYDVGTFHVERGDGPQWVCRSFGWPISIGKSNNHMATKDSATETMEKLIQQLQGEIRTLKTKQAGQITKKHDSLSYKKEKWWSNK